MPLYFAAEQDGRVGDAYGHRDGADDAASHGHEAPLVAPCSATGRLGAQLPRTGVSAFGDDAARAAIREESTYDGGARVGLHGVVHGSRAAAWQEAGVEGLVGPSSRCVAGEQGLGGARPHRQQGGDDRRGHLLRNNKPSTTGERRAEEPTEKESAEAKSAEEKSGEESAEEPTVEDQLDDDASSDVVEVLGGKEGDQSSGEQSNDSDVVEVPVEEVKLRRSSRPSLEKPAENLSYHACLPSTSYSTLLDDAEDDVDLPELDPDLHANPEHRWDIATMTVKEALASWKGKAVKVAMDKEIKSLITNGTWELVERPCGVNIMKNRWVLMMKYHVDDTVSHEKARLVVKGFTQVYGANYDKTCAPVGSYVTLRIFLNIGVVLDLHLMQLDMKNTSLQSKLDCVLYMYQPDYYNVGTGRVCKLLNSTAMLKELLEAAFELREISPVEKYLGLEIVHDRLARKLWLHQQIYVDNLRRHFIDEEQTGRVPKTPVSVDAYSKLTFDDEEEEYRQKVAASSQVFAAASGSGPESAPCSCRLLSHQTLLWHHRLGHPSLPRLQGMASRVLVSGLPRSLPPLPPGPAPTCVPCVEGRQRAAPHSSEFPPTEAPLQTLHVDVWGPARVRGQGHERYFLLVVDDYSRYTTVFPLRSKGEVPEVLIDWIRAARLRLSESFGSEFPVLRLHSDRGGEFSSARLGAFCRAQGIRQTFTLPASPQQNGIAERRIGMVMDVARTSMIHAAAPHFLSSFAVQYAAHQLNLQPRVSLPETSPTLLWTGKVGDASAFRVWGSRAFVRDFSADKLSPRATPCVFLGFPPDAPGWQFYHPTSRRVLSSLDVTFDESVPYYHLFPYRTAPLPPPPLFLAPGPPPVDPLPPQGPAPSGVSQLDAVEPVEVAVDSGAATGAEPAGAGSGGTEPGGAESGGAEPGGTVLGSAEPGGAEPRGAEPRGAEPGGAAPGGAELRGALPGGSPGASSLCEPLSPQELREWFARRWRRAAGAGGSSTTEGAAVAGPGGARTVRTGAAGPVGSTGVGAADGVGPKTSTGGPAGGTPGPAGGSGAAGGAAREGASAGGTGAVPEVSGVAARPRPYFVPLLEQVLGSPLSAGLPPSLACPQPVQSQLQLQPTSPLPAPSPYTVPIGGLAERREPASRPASPVRDVRTSGRSLRQRPPPVPGTHRMSLRPSTAPLRVPLPSPPESSLPALADPESDSLRAASPTVTRLLATVVTDPSFESTAASALVTELVDFAACCRLDYAASLVTESASASVCPPSVGGECALGTDVLEDRQEEFQCLAAASPHLVSVLLTPEGDPDALDIPTPRYYAEAIEGPYSSQWQAAMDAEMASWKSTGTYVDAVPPSGANIVSGMWIFRVKRPPGSPPVFKARYVARGFSERQGVDYFQTFSPTPKMTTLRVLLHVAAHRDYELHSLDFSTAFLQGSLHEEIWLRRPPGFTGSFPPGTQWSLRRPVYGLRQAPREWHDTLRTTLAALWFAPSTADPSLFLRADTSLPPFYILVYVDDLVFATADTAGLAYVKSELQKRHTCTDLGELRSYLGLQITRDRAQRTITFLVQQLHVLLHLTAVPPQPRIFVAAQPSSSSFGFSAFASGVTQHVLYVDNKAMLALCREQRLEHRTKHIALRYFLARELQQRDQLRLAYVASQANTADVFTKALAPCDHQRFCTQLGLSEYVAASEAGKEARRLRFLLAEFQLLDVGKPTMLHVDNLSAITIIEGLGLKGNLKHMERRYAWLQHMVKHGKIALQYIPTTEQPADFLTKALHFPAFNRCSVAIGQVRLADVGFYGSKASHSTPSSGDLRVQAHWPSRLRQRTTAPVESHLPGLGPFPAAQVENCVSSLGACAFPSPGAAEGLCVGAAATTSLVSAFGARSGATSQTAQLSFTLESGASSYFFRNCTDLTPLHTPIIVVLADPSVESVVARITTALPCPAAPSEFLTGYYTPSFSTNLVDVSHLHDQGVVTNFPLDEPVASYTVSATGAPLATFHREPGSSLYSLHTGSRHTGSGQVRSGQFSHSRLPRPRSPAPPCTPCVEGRQRAAPHSSSFPPTTAPFQTLHLDVWGPSLVLGPRQESYFLIVVDDYSRYTTVFPLRRKADVPTVLEPWLLARGGAQALCGLDLHSDHGGEFSSTRLETFCQGRGIIQSYTLPASPQQNGVAERRIGLVMEVARTSMCHASAPQFLWPQAVRYAALQLNLWPGDTRPRVAPVSLWTGSPSVAANFRVWGSLAHVRAPSVNKLSPRTRAYVFLGFPLNTAGWVFYDPLTYEFLSSQADTFDESVCYYRGRPNRVVSYVTPRSPPPQHPVPVVSGGAKGAAAEGEGAGAAGAGGVGSRGAGGVGVEVTPVEDTAASTRRPRPASPPGFPSVPHFPPHSSLRPVVAELGGVPTGGIGGPVGVGGGGAGSGGARAGGTGIVAPRPCTVRFLTREQRLLLLDREEREQFERQEQLQPQQERVEESWPHQERVEQESHPHQQQRVQLQPQQERVEEEPQEQQQGQVPSQQTPKEAEQRRLRLRDLPNPAPARLVHGPLLSPPIPPVLSLSLSQWTRCSPLSRAVSPEPHRSRYRADGLFHLVLRSRVPPPSVLPQPPESSLTVLHELLFNYLRASRPVVSRVLSALVTHPTAPLSSVSALVTTITGFASSHRLDYAAHLVSGPARSPSSGGTPVFPLEVLEDRQFELGFLAAAIAAKEVEMASYRSASTYVDAVPPPGTNVVSGRWLYKVKRPPGSPPVFKARYVARGFSQREGVDFFQTFAPTPKMSTLRVLLHIAAQRDYELHSLDFSTAFLQGSLHERIWMSLDFFPSSADPSLFDRRGSTPFFVLVYVDYLVFATPDRHVLASVKEELQRRHTCTDLGELQHYLGLQINRDRAARTITPTQSHMVEQILIRFCFPFSKVQLSPLAVDHGLTAPPSDESFESSGPYSELVGCLIVLARFVVPGRHRPSHKYTSKRVAKYVASTSGMGLVLGGKQPVTHTGYSDSSWADDAETRRSTQGYSFSLLIGAVSWRSTRALSVSRSSCDAEVYAAAMAA
ncbi:unnamed protein product [Closterium sp. NIES-53]